MKEIGYEDERLADGTVCRRFEDGRTEWRTRLPDERVGWRDATGGMGVDELLGDGIVKRTHSSGKVEYAREQGYGRTAWANEVVTVNRTSLGTRVGAGLALVGLGAAAVIVAPPLTLTAAEEEALRKKKQEAANDSGGSSSSDASGGGDGWGTDEDANDSDGDFG